MTNKQVVRTIEPNTCIEKRADGYVIYRAPGGYIFGTGKTEAKAWANARLSLFGGTVGKILSEIPVRKEV